jgi:hypothetical protein
MEVDANIGEGVRVDEEGFICCSGKDYLKQLRSHQQEKGLAVLTKIITLLGERSAVSQKLKQVITTPAKFYGTDHRIYIKVAGTKALGFVKVGEKRLFYHDYVPLRLSRSAVLRNSCPPPSSTSTSTKAASAPASARYSPRQVGSLREVPQDRGPDPRTTGLRPALRKTHQLPQKTLRPQQLHPPEQQLRHLRPLLQGD